MGVIAVVGNDYFPEVKTLCDFSRTEITESYNNYLNNKCCNYWQIYYLTL